MHFRIVTNQCNRWRYWGHPGGRSRKLTLLVGLMVWQSKSMANYRFFSENINLLIIFFLRKSFLHFFSRKNITLQYIAPKICDRSYSPTFLRFAWLRVIVNTVNRFWGSHQNTWMCLSHQTKLFEWDSIHYT